jgi:hypothetical protein
VKSLASESGCGPWIPREGASPLGITSEKPGNGNVDVSSKTSSTQVTDNIFGAKYLVSGSRSA